MQLSCFPKWGFTCLYCTLCTLQTSDMNLAIILKILILICIKLGLHFISLTNKVTDTYHRIHLNQTLKHTVLLLHQFNSIQKNEKGSICCCFETGFIPVRSSFEEKIKNGIEKRKR